MIRNKLIKMHMAECLQSEVRILSMAQLENKNKQKCVSVGWRIDGDID